MPLNSIIPDTPRVISPSPTPSEQASRDYFVSAKGRQTTQDPITEETDLLDEPEFARARPRSRSPQLPFKTSTTQNGSLNTKTTRRKPDPIALKEPDHDERDAHLSPASALLGKGSAYWRQLSRSPSPLGLIPIHKEWRTFIHKHEIPRKFLHVSIGFVTLYLFLTGSQADDIHPVLLTLLIPIFTVDFLRMRWP